MSIDAFIYKCDIHPKLNPTNDCRGNLFSDCAFLGVLQHDPYPEDQEISAMCRTILQNIIILWNYVELTKIIMRSDKETQGILLEHITSASILTWQHVSLHETYDFSNLVAANSNEYSIDEVIHFKVA